MVTEGGLGADTRRGFGIVQTNRTFKRNVPLKYRFWFLLIRNRTQFFKVLVLFDANRTESRKVPLKRKFKGTF